MTMLYWRTLWQLVTYCAAHKYASVQRSLFGTTALRVVGAGQVPEAM
jgi:hypothetical protein